MKLKSNSTVINTLPHLLVCVPIRVYFELKHFLSASREKLHFLILWHIPKNKAILLCNISSIKTLI